MKLDKYTKMRVSTIMVFTLAVTAVATCAGNTQADASEQQIRLTAGVADAFYAQDLSTLDVTAGISEVLMDTSVVRIADTDVVTVGQGLEEYKAEDDALICGYTNLGVATVEGSLNVREKATTDSEIVGKMNNHAACEILETDGDWVQIKSGKVKGYVKSEYLLTGDEAAAVAKKEIVTVATVNTMTLHVRKEATVDSSIVALVGEGEDLVVEAEKDGWYKVEVDDQTGYISGEYVEISEKLPTAQTITEVKYGNGVSDVRVSLVQYALQFVGNRYVWGGTSLTNGVDCSGFTMQVYAHFGVGLPHHSGSQPGYGTRINASSARPGDLFFYGSGSHISHVGIYIGNGQIVHASNSRTGIIVSNAFYRSPICVVSYLP